jgi:hypothetical protein
LEAKSEEPLDPIRRRDDYEECDVDMVPVAFDTSDTGSEDEYDSTSDIDMPPSQGESAVVIDANEDEDDQLDSEVPASDWDSQEELSGDEAALVQTQDLLSRPKSNCHST